MKENLFRQLITLFITSFLLLQMYSHSFLIRCLILLQFLLPFCFRESIFWSLFSLFVSSIYQLNFSPFDRVNWCFIPKSIPMGSFVCSLLISFKTSSFGIQQTVCRQNPEGFFISCASASSEFSGIWWSPKILKRVCFYYLLTVSFKF